MSTGEVSLTGRLICADDEQIEAAASVLRKLATRVPKLPPTVWLTTPFAAIARA